MKTNTKTDFPIIQTQRLTLREITSADRDAIFKIFSDKAVTKYYDVETMQNIESADELIAWWQNRIKTGQAFRWGITITGDNQIIGTCGFSELDMQNFRGEIGCELIPAFWGQGFMTEALQAVLQYGFEKMGLHRIETWIMKENLASIRVFQKLGMQYEGLLCDRQYWDGKFNDVVMYGLIKNR